MPEKPEVLTVVKSLKKKILGKTITACNIYWDNIIASPTPSVFKQQIIDQKINSITTRGKWIVIKLDDYNLLIHLRMEGKFFFRTKGDEKLKHEHVEFILDDNISFRFHDVRKFGKMYLIENDKVNNTKPLNEIGLEFDDKNLTKEYLFDKINTKKLPIKTVLLDQSIIAGIGNIYDDEILFMSGINPNRKANEVSLKDCDNIIKNTNIVLNKAIKLGGTTIKSFTSEEGVHGLFQNELLVHGKAGTNCPKCGTMIEKTKIGGRGTHYCPKCQNK
ncbi:MAG: DNA-formamidopyrimidine glycosylase [Firmicutes bacterium]|nr:DNA-formamidopyrimidine glycosylase [Bacillota bacterium]